MHRYEPSGALHGLMRVRGFTQDDAHVFCTDEQLEDECMAIDELIRSVYRDFGFGRDRRQALDAAGENGSGRMHNGIAPKRSCSRCSSASRQNPVARSRPASIPAKALSTARSSNMS